MVKSETDLNLRNSLNIFRIFQEDGNWESHRRDREMIISGNSEVSPSFFDITISVFGYGSIPINTIFRGMNIHLPAVLMFTRGTRFWHTAISVFLSGCSDKNRGLTWSEPLTVTRAYAVDLGRLDELHSYKRWVNQNVDPSYTSYKISCNHG